MRLRVQWLLVVILCAVSWLLGLEQSTLVTAFPDFCRAEMSIKFIPLALPILFCTAIGMIAAFCNRNVAALSDLQLLEQSAPLYGRQLARATALVPCLIAALASIAYGLAARASSGAGVLPGYFLLLFISVTICTTLITLSAGLRSGWQKLLYVWLAFGAAFIGIELAAGFPCYSPLGFICEVSFCGLVGFVALRAYGETLARYDPIAE